MPVILVGTCERMFGMDGICKTIAELRLLEAFEFSILVIEKAKEARLGRGYATFFELLRAPSRTRRTFQKFPSAASKF